MKGKVAFFGKALLVACLVLAFLFGVVMPQYTEGFNAALIDKAARLRSTVGPKIVLIGNSNLAFGVDSQALERAFDMPVVNMGLHGGAGNAFHESMAKLNVQPGDLYIICHTEYDDVDVIDDPSLVWTALENHFSLYPLLRAKDVPTMAKAFSTYVKKALDLWAEGAGNRATEDAYARAAFNAYGDNTFARPQRDANVQIAFESQSVPEIGEACVARLNALNEYLTRHGATMLVAGYPIANGEFTPLVSEYEAFQAALEAALDCPVISYFPNYMLDYDYFFDTMYHLTDDGVRMRTNILIDELDVWMARAAQ